MQIGSKEWENWINAELNKPRDFTIVGSQELFDTVDEVIKQEIINFKLPKTPITTKFDEACKKAFYRNRKA